MELPLNLASTVGKTAAVLVLLLGAPAADAQPVEDESSTAATSAERKRRPKCPSSDEMEQIYS